MTRVFLGGTCNNSTWREKLIPMLKIDYFNPVTDNWNIAAQQEELHQRQVCDYILYLITREMKGVYSIAEAVDDSNKRPTKTIFCVLAEGFDDIQLQSLHAVKRLVERNGAVVFDDLESIANFLNEKGV